MTDDPTDDPDQYDMSVDITTDADRLADEFASLEKEEAELANYVWPPTSRKLIKQKCPNCGSPLYRERAEEHVWDWCFQM
jgi:hypothetical protein